METSPGASPAAAWNRVGLTTLAAATITALLYGRSLALPFYSDDLVQIPWLHGLSLAELWQQISPYGYYRPLAFSLWLLARTMGLPWTPAALRALNLIAHTAASVVVGDLADRLDPSRRRAGGVLAAALFAAYPFAYQAVPWVSGLFYPLSLLLTAGAVTAYLRFRRSPRMIWLALSLSATLLAAFAHENGLLTSLLVILAEAIAVRRAAGGRLCWWPLAHTGIGVGALALWLTLRQQGVSTLDLSPAAIASNLTVLITGASYPLAWLAELAALGQPLLRPLGVWGAAATVLAVLGWVWRKDPAPLLFCAGWFSIGIGPVAATMRPDWLADAPRFLYFAGAGAAAAWGLTVGRAADSHPHWLPLCAGLSLLTALPGAGFAAQGVGWHLRGGAAIQDAVAHAEDGGLLLVNLPDRVAPPRSLYPYFSGGAILLPAQVSAGDIVGSHTGMPRNDVALTVGSILAPVAYERTTYGPLADAGMLEPLLASGQTVLVADYSALPSVRLRRAGRVLESSPGALHARFGEALALRQARVLPAGSTVEVVLIWESTAPLDGAPTVFVHVVDSSGTLVAQGDGDPLAGLYPLNVWQPGTVVEDIRYLQLPEHGSFTITVGVWQPATGERLPAARTGSTADQVAIARIIR